jgi:type IV pilus assembly protein PilV
MNNLNCLRSHLSHFHGRGFTLIEVLVAIVVLSIGLLGLAGLQAISLQNNHSAYLRMQATLAANDMTDRMRANMGAVKAKNYNKPTATQHTECKTTTGCSPQYMAENDAYEWNTNTLALLPSGAGVVCIDSTPNDADATPVDPQCDDKAAGSYVIKVWWKDDRDPSGKLMRFVTSFQP